MRRHGDGDGRVDARQLFDRDRVGDGVTACAAVLLGDREAHEPELGELRDELVRKPSLFVQLGGNGRDPLAGERSNRVADELLLRCWIEVHAAADGSRVPG